MSDWLSREFAEAQYAVVSDELRGIFPEPYLVFAEAMAHVTKKETLLDIGCGVGGYAFVCKKLFPETAYTGADISKHMIWFAKRICPTATFYVRELFDNFAEGCNYDVVLTSSTIEYTPDPWEALEFLLSHASRNLILHRLHLTGGQSHEVHELSYCGKRINKMHWNANEVCDFIGEQRVIEHARVWANGNMLSVVLKPVGERQQPER